MRTIKFRCFYRGKMYQVKEMQFYPDGSYCVSIIEMDIDGLPRDVSPDSEHVKGIMQSTGLLDKTRKEIYEGDIVRFRVTIADQEYDSGVVRWSDGGFWTSQPENYQEELLSEELDELEGEVICNIYELQL